MADVAALLQCAAGCDPARSGDTLLRKVPLLLLLLPTALFADQVFLKDAGSITGRIVDQNATTVRVDVGGGIIGVPMDRVEKIVKARCALDEFDDRAKKLAPSDVAGWKKLAQWAASESLSAQAQLSYKKVLAVAPNDPEANAAFGRMQLDGKWVSQEESYRAKGYVQYDGEWMTAAEAQLAESRAANDRSRRDAENRAADAESAARDADARAAKAEEKAKNAESRNNSNVYWGGFGYGVNSWPQGDLVNAGSTWTPWPHSIWDDDE